MRTLPIAILAMITISLNVHHARAQTSVIQQNSVSVNGQSSSVTITGGSISVDTSGTGGRVIGDGQAASEERPIGPVAAIHSDGAFALTIVNGPAPKLDIEADKNLLPIIKTEVTNGRLNIYSDRSYTVDGRIRITVSSPDISEISASGSNHIEASGFAGGPLSVALNGSNTASLSGKAGSLTCVLSGANHLAARRLGANQAKVTVNGSGDAAVDAREAVAAAVFGAGSITVYGNPKARRTAVNGAGRITFAE
jgi:Putative auto-transporter adhesin, head GIN domain